MRRHAKYVASFGGGTTDAPYGTLESSRAAFLVREGVDVDNGTPTPEAPKPRRARRALPETGATRDQRDDSSAVLLFGRLVRSKRGQRSQAQVSAECAMDARRLAQIESGKRPCTVVEMLHLMRVLGIPWLEVEMVMSHAFSIESIFPDPITPIDFIFAQIATIQRLRVLLGEASDAEAKIAELHVMATRVTALLQYILQVAITGSAEPSRPDATEDGETSPATPPETEPQ